MEPRIIDIIVAATTKLHDMTAELYEHLADEEFDKGVKKADEQIKFLKQIKDNFKSRL